MLSYTEIDEKIRQGYIKICEEKNYTVGCDVWLEAWEGVKSIMEAESLSEIFELDKKYPWGEFISNYVQDLEMELRNAETKGKSYAKKRIAYCRELIERCGTDQLMIENSRRAIAESYFDLGDYAQSDRLYEEWLEADPDWGWGYIGWSDCYAWKPKEPRYDKAEEILELGLNHASLRDKNDVLERAIEISEKFGHSEKAREHRNELHRMASVRVKKIGPNEPCPCGSGKKHKKCCAP